MGWGVGRGGQLEGLQIQNGRIAPSVFGSGLLPFCLVAVAENQEKRHDLEGLENV